MGRVVFHSTWCWSSIPRDFASDSGEWDDWDDHMDTATSQSTHRCSRLARTTREGCEALVQSVPWFFDVGFFDWRTMNPLLMSGFCCIVSPVIASPWCVRLSMVIPYPMWDDFPCPWRYSLQTVDVWMEKTFVNGGIVHCHVWGLQGNTCFVSCLHCFCWLFTPFQNEFVVSKVS